MRKIVRSISEAAFTNISVPLKLKLNLPLKKKRKKIQFEICLVEHCNLNCKSCAHFSPLAEPYFLGIEEFERDMKRMGELFDHECDLIWLFGGEPLLHPEINKFMKIAREIFSKGRIGITTNGILLAQKDEDFWRTCHDNDIFFRISHYPIEINAEKIKAMAKKFDVKCHWYIYSEKDEFLVFALDLEGRQNFKKNFALCSFPNSCIGLLHGKLFSCDIPMGFRFFNKEFNKNLQVTEDDYIDIYKAKNKDEIFEKLTRPMPACRYCNRTKWRPIKWGASKRIIDEWI